jgi:hypothetical protein
VCLISHKKLIVIKDGQNVGLPEKKTGFLPVSFFFRKIFPCNVRGTFIIEQFIIFLLTNGFISYK